MKNNEMYQGIIIHPYITRQGNPVLLLNNTTADSMNAFVMLLDIAENLCICNQEHFEKLLPVFKEFYSLVGDADAEVKFIREQRKGKRYIL